MGKMLLKKQAEMLRRSLHVVPRVDAGDVMVSTTPARSVVPEAGVDQASVPAERSLPVGEAPPVTAKKPLPQQSRRQAALRMAEVRILPTSGSVDPSAVSISSSSTPVTTRPVSSSRDAASASIGCSETVAARASMGRQKRNAARTKRQKPKAVRD